MKHGSLFSGIGGFDLAAEWMGWENKFHCEWNEFGQKVLHHYWPEAELFTDITKSNFTKYANRIDVLSGGFPCQPYSSAGKRLGKEDERHLWPEMLRAIREIQPSWVVGENVRGLTNWNGGMVFNEVQADLEAQGYEVTPFLLPASSVGARHKRDRIWIIAYSECTRLEYRHKDRYLQSESRKTSEKRSCIANDPQTISSGFNRSWRINEKTKDIICNGDDGLSNRLDSITFSKWRNESIKAGGNAVVPQVVYQIFKAIQEFEQLKIV